MHKPLDLKTLDIVDLERQYDNFIKPYKKFAEDLRYIFLNLLNSQGVSYAVFFPPRIKEFDSFFEKVVRKGYKKPFDDNDDFCGFRIVTYYLSDLDNIDQFLQSNFRIVKKPPKKDIEKDDLTRFAYRSRHYIAKLKKEWLNLPLFKNAGHLKFEIQVRTLNMHSWGEASHRSYYKGPSGLLPDELLRELSRASALLEQVDGMFESIRLGIEKVAKNQDNLNQFSLRHYLSKAFPDKKLENYKLLTLLREMEEGNVGISDIDKGLKLLDPHLEQIEKDLAKFWPSAIGAARAILDITVDDFFENKIAVRNKRWVEGVKFWKDKLKKNNGQS